MLPEEEGARGHVRPVLVMLGAKWAVLPLRRMRCPSLDRWQNPLRATWPNSAKEGEERSGDPFEDKTHTNSRDHVSLGF
jgi:hypothetical protein